jgi:hypothetical protein
LNGEIKLTFELIGQVTRNPSSQKVRQIYSKVKPPHAVGRITSTDMEAVSLEDLHP